MQSHADNHYYSCDCGSTMQFRSRFQSQLNCAKAVGCNAVRALAICTLLSTSCCCDYYRVSQNTYECQIENSAVCPLYICIHSYVSFSFAPRSHLGPPYFAIHLINQCTFTVVVSCMCVSACKCLAYELL